LGRRYILGAGTTLTDALKELAEHRISKPDLILLDLYFGPDINPEKRKEMLIADEQLAVMERRVRALLIASGQSPDKGFDLVNETEKRCPRVARAFFSRRAFLEDAMRAHKMGLPLLEKPDPDEGEDYDKAFKRHADVIAGEIDRIIYLNSWWVRWRPRVEGFVVGVLGLVVKIGWDLLTH